VKTKPIRLFDPRCLWSDREGRAFAGTIDLERQRVGGLVLDYLRTHPPPRHAAAGAPEWDKWAAHCWPALRGEIIGLDGKKTVEGFLGHTATSNLIELGRRFFAARQRRAALIEELKMLDMIESAFVEEARAS
jgi:hypothetical protein